MLDNFDISNDQSPQAVRASEQPDFSIAVPPRGYAWWYVDGVSDDGQSGLTIIAFIGSVFSPYYARARRGGDPNPENFVAFNTCLYGSKAKRWTMTERGRASLRRTRDEFTVGPSTAFWSKNELAIAIDEIAVPLPRRVKGNVRVRPVCMPGRAFSLDHGNTQTWQPVAPMARIEVRFSAPAISWDGHAYFDHNRGTMPLESAFQCWDWSRQTAANTTRIIYDVTERGGAKRHLSLQIDKNGAITPFPPPPRVALAASLWRIKRETRTDPGTKASLIDTLEDTPFYARSLLQTTCLGETAPSVHESLDLDRFNSRIVQSLLPFRMPRRA